MRRRRLLSMRWWLALAFAVIAALTALAVSQVFRASSESAIRDRAAELAAGSAVAAATRLSGPTDVRELRSEARRVAAEREIALFLFDTRGSLLTPAVSGGVELGSLPNLASLLDGALQGERQVETIDDGRLVTVALPLRRGPAAGLVAVASRPDLEDALGIVQQEIISAALWATLVGAVLGLVVASLITLRLRRIADSAAEIEQGRFDHRLESRFPDELGELAETVDRMRSRLQESFTRLETERDRLQRLLEQLQEGVIAVDRDQLVVFANSRARVLLGPGLAQGERLPEPWAGASLRETAASLFRPGAEPETMRVRPDASHAYVVAGLPAAPDGDSVVLVVTDVTVRERRERAEREFVANAAHELRTPLAAITSAVEVLQAGAGEMPEERERFLALVDRQASRLTRLVHALLTLARTQTDSEPIRLEVVDLGSIIRDAAGDLELQGLQATVECDGSVYALGQADLLRQVVDNLASNAVLHAGGEGLVLRAAQTPSGRVRIEVADAGPGMPPQLAERALDRFYRAPEAAGSGFGLGLSIVREVVAALGGEVSIESAPQRGTTVRVELAAPVPEEVVA